MLSTLLAFVGGILFAGIIAAWNCQADQKSNHFSVLPNRPLSLWSLILFLFFLPLNEFCIPKHLMFKSRRHTGNYSEV